MHAIAASLERLAATWAEHYRCFPCLFDQPWPTVGDSRFDAWLSNIWGADDMVAWHDPRGLLHDGVVTRGLFADVLRSAVVWRCIRQACGGDAHTGASWTPIVIQRARMLAAVLGSVDQWGRRQLVANGFLVAQLPWERFCRGDWWSVCDYTRVNDHPTPLAVRVAGWACEHCSCVPEQGPGPSRRRRRRQSTSAKKKGKKKNGTTRQRDIFPLAHLDSVDVLWPGYPSPLQQRELLLYVNSVATVLSDLWGVRPGSGLPGLEARPAAPSQGHIRSSCKGNIENRRTCARTCRGAWKY